MELTKTGWIPSKEYDNCYNEIRHTLNKYTREQIDSFVDAMSLISSWCRDLSDDNEYNFKFNPLTVLCIYAEMYMHEGEEIIEEMVDEELAEEMRACIRKHTVNGQMVADEECEECYCPDCIYWCELNARSGSRLDTSPEKVCDKYCGNQGSKKCEDCAYGKR